MKRIRVVSTLESSSNEEHGLDVDGECEASPTWRRRLVRPQEGPHLVDRLLEQVLRLSPGESRRLRLRRERGDVSTDV
jgi:hypothetical protein